MTISTTSGAARQLRTLSSEDVARALDAVATYPAGRAMPIYGGMYRLTVKTSLGPLVLLFTETRGRRLLLSARLVHPLGVSSPHGLNVAPEGG
jgi:hypothetical protein